MGHAFLKLKLLRIRIPKQLEKSFHQQLLIHREAQVSTNRFKSERCKARLVAKEIPFRKTYIADRRDLSPDRACGGIDKAIVRHNGP